MNYLDGFRNTQAAKAITKDIAELAARFSSERTVRIMEVCGTHTQAVGKYGIRSVLPNNVELISGPGCPVCVTDAGYIDTAMQLAKTGVTVITFGDMLKVPGSRRSLADARADGGLVEIVYSPLEALKLAQQNPAQEFVFLAIGFETTAAPIVSLLDRVVSAGVNNLSFLTAFKLVPPALEILADDPELKLDAFLAPAHVSAIIGAKAYYPVVERFKVPAVIAGFEPLDILYGLRGILVQLLEQRPAVENQYSRVVREEGNLRAQELIEKYLQPVNTYWRGLGELPLSGLGLRDEYAHYDAEKRLGIAIEPGRPPAKCLCGSVLRGIIKPPECELFGRQCLPEHPVGPCMVSSEGSCSAYYRYVQLEVVQ